jgi:hypothetical protein
MQGAFGTLTSGAGTCVCLVCILSFTDATSRSVHNTHIERLCYDLTNGFGQKWKNFFLDLEHNHSLDHTNLAHIWLLHVLFLDVINANTKLWAEM